MSETSSLWDDHPEHMRMPARSMCECVSEHHGPLVDAKRKSCGLQHSLALDESPGNRFRAFQEILMSSAFSIFTVGWEVGEKS